MKLRLPHKFQAALMAALASVSFTTLSTGTLAVATGAVLLAGQQAQAATGDEVNTALSKAITGSGYVLGDAYSLEITLDDSCYGSVTSNTDKILLSSSETNLALHILRDGGAVKWGYIGMGTAPALAKDDTNKILPDEVTGIDTAGGTVATWNISNGEITSGAWLNRLISGEPGSYTLGNASAIYAGQAKVGVTSDGTNTTLTYTITTSKPGAGIPSQYIINLEGVALDASKLTFGSDGINYSLDTLTFSAEHAFDGYTWAATADGSSWSDAVWTKGAATNQNFVDGSNAVFNASAQSKQVLVGSAVQAHDITVDGAAYTFTGNGSVTSTTITFTGEGAGLTLATKLDLTGQTDLSALANVTVAQGGTLAVAAGTKSVINLNAVSAGTLEIMSGSVSNTSVIGTADATLKLDGGTALYFDNNANHEFNHNIALGGDATIEVYGSSYHPNGVTITGNVSGAGHMLTKQDLGQLTINGQVNLGTLKLNSASTVIINSSEGAKSSIDDVDSVTGSTLRITNADVNLKGNNSQSFQSSLEIGQGATVRVKDTDSMKWGDYTNTITLLEGGTLDFEQKRLSIGSGTTIVMAGGTIQGVGDGTAAMDYHQDGTTIRATANSTISATIQLRNGNQTTNFNVENGTALTVSGTVKGSGNLHKLGAGELVLSGTLSYTGTTAVDAGTLTVGSAYSINSAKQLKVNGGSANFNGAVTIGNAGSFSVADGATLTFGGTVAVTRNTVDTRKYGPSRETGNGFGYTYTYASVGAGASGGTWTLNSHAATYNAATGEVGWTVDDGGTYYIYTPEAISAVMAKNPTAVTVDTLGATQELGNGSYSLTRLQIDSGVVTTTHSNGTGVVTGDIVINAGGTFKVIGEHDAFGYDGGQTDNIIMTGAAGNLATLELHQTSNNSVTMQTNIQMHGYSQILDAGTQHKGFNTYGGSITVTGTNNVIDHMSLRKPVTVTVDSGADLVVTTLDNDIHDDTRDLTKQGAGSLTLSNSSATIRNLNLNGGTLTFAGGTTTVNGTLLNDNVNVSSELVIGTDAQHTAILKVNRLENGNVNNVNTHSDVTINTGSTLKITGSNTDVDYKQASLVLGEWNVAPSTVTVRGSLIADQTHILAGDHGYTMNINGGTVLAKGLKTNGKDNRTQNINITNGGKLILGDAGITTANAGGTANTSVDNGTIGVYADNVSIEKNIALSGAVTFDTQMYTVSDTTVSRGDAGGNLSISGNLTGNATITKDGAGTLTLTGANTITHTIDLKAGSLALNGGSVTVSADNIANFEQVEGSSATTYSQGENGYLTGSADYYLVKGAEGTQVTQSLQDFIGGTLKMPQPSGKDLVFTFAAPTDSVYYVNTQVTYGDDDAVAATSFVIKEGATLTAANGDAYGTAKVLHGTGTYALASGVSAMNSGLSLGSDWTGTVRISGVNFGGNMNTINNLANSNSWVELVGVHGWFDNSTINANLILGEDANGWGYYQDNGANNKVLTINGVVKGTGKFGRSNTTGQYQTHVFTNDISGWTGTYEARSADDRSTTLRLTNNAHEVNATLTRASGVFNVDVQTDVAFSKAITVTTLAVTAGHTATLGANATLGGLTGAGNIASTAEITLNGGSGTAYEFGGAITGAHLLNKTGAGTQTINGPVTVDRFTISGGTTTFNGLVTGTGTGYDGNNRRMSVSGGTVYFNNGFAYSGDDGYALVTSGNSTVHFGGNSDLSGKSIGPVATAKIVLDAGATLKLAQLLNSPSDSSANGKLEMKSGSVLTVTNAMRLTGASSEGGTIHLGNNVTVDLHAGSYTPIMEFGMGAVVLDGANATIQTLSHGGTVKLDSIEGTGTLTLKANSGSTARNTFSIGGSATKSELTKFHGTLALERVGNGPNRVLLAEFNDKYSAADAVVQATLSGTHNSEAVGILINSDVVQMKGLKDGTGITSANSYALASGSASALADTGNAGAATYLDSASDGTPRTLEFVGNDAQASYTTGIKVLSGVNITMSAAGSQTFNGDLSTMNGTVTASAGTLTLNNTGATRGTLASVTYNGGTLVLNNMDVAGATTIGQGTTLDLGATNLTSAIVNQGTVNFTQNITASGLAKVGEDQTFFVGADDAAATNDNRFAGGQRTESTIRVVSGGTVNPAGHTVTQDDVAYTLKANGTATGALADAADYSVFLQYEAGSELDYSHIEATAAKHGKADELVVFTANATLNIDSASAYAMLANATVNIAKDLDFQGGLGVMGGENTITGQIDTARVSFATGANSEAVFTDAPVQADGVRFTSDAGKGGVVVDAAAVQSSDGVTRYSVSDGRFTVMASELTKVNGEDVSVAHSVMVERVHNSAASATGKLTLEAGVAAVALKEVVATSGNIEFLNMGDAELRELEIGRGKAVSMYTGSVAEVAQEASVTVTGTLTAGEGATLNANLVMGSKSTLDVSGTNGAGLLMGSSVTLNPGVTLSDGDMVAITGMGFMDQYTLFTGVDAFSYDGTTTPSAAPIAFDSATWVKASEVFSNTEFTGGKDYYLFYGGAENGSNVGAIFVMQIPEPATGTLSLLALAALAARRRRRG